MSGKSKRKGAHKAGQVEVFNRCLLCMLWAIVEVLHPQIGVLQAIKEEAFKVFESLKAGRLTDAQIVAQLRDEYDILTDWSRRDRQ